MPARSTQPSIEDIFSMAQESCAKHKKCAAALRKLQSSMPFEEFAADFFSCVACVLPVFKRERAVERIVEFVVAYTTQGAEGEAVDEALMESVCARLLKLSAAKDKAVRFRVIQLVGQMMNALAEEAEVSDELFESIEEAAVERCKDKVPVVRAWALRALFRLQDPADADDRITKALLRAMAHDASKEVRMAAVSTVAPSKHAIRAILERTRDTEPEVRVHALRLLESKAEMKWLQISQRASLLSAGLQDRDAKVAAAATKLAAQWLRKQGKDANALLKALDVASYEEPAALTLRALLDADTALVGEGGAAPLVAAAAAGWRTLAPEPLLSLRVHLQWLAAEPSRQAALDDALPELPDFCAALAEAAAAQGGETSGGTRGSFALAQLLHAAPLLDMSNEHGREALEGQLKRLLKSLATADDALAPAMRALSAACRAADGDGERAAFQRLVLELIGEVEDPLEAEVDEGIDAEEAAAAERRERERMEAQGKLAAVHAELADAQEIDDLEKVEELTAKAATMAASVAAMEAESAVGGEELHARTQRCLQLAECLMLQAGHLTLKGHELQALKTRFPPAFTNHSPEIRALAVRCLALYCHNSAAETKGFWSLFETTLSNDHHLVQLEALRACVDLLLLHSPEALLGSGGEAAASSTTLEVELSQLLTPLLQGPPGALRTAAACGLARLLHAGRTRSSTLLARLLLIHFEEVTTNDAASSEELRQFLSVFFAAASGSAAAAADVAAAALPAVRTVLAAAPGSADASVQLEPLVNFVAALTRPEAAGGNAAPDVHEELALALCCEAALEPDEKEGRLLPRCLPQLVLPAGGARLAALAAVVTKLEKALTDKVALKKLGEFASEVDRKRAAGEAAAEAAGEEVDLGALLSAHEALRRADPELAAARDAEGSRARDEDADEERRATPRKGAPPPRAGRKRLAKSKATPARVGLELDENATANEVA